MKHTTMVERVQVKKIIADNGAVEINGGDGFLVTGEFQIGDTIPTIDDDTQMFFLIREKAAFPCW